uniref:Uncharacterized protein n=1 Tax=Siphoviridae sp. ctxMM9 TaxID=2827973 RepID=A0A8S5T6C9_9CAUD|nr:MAG TPA: hypothetical protein [Siphoviridae sp. ctxMM9]
MSLRSTRPFKSISRMKVIFKVGRENFFIIIKFYFIWINKRSHICFCISFAVFFYPSSLI